MILGKHVFRGGVENIIHDSLKHTSKEMKIMLGKDLVIDILDITNNESQYMTKYGDFLKMASIDTSSEPSIAINGKKYVQTRRFLIDL
jgi:hypothetical protein